MTTHTQLGASVANSVSVASAAALCNARCGPTPTAAMKGRVVWLKLKLKSACPCRRRVKTTVRVPAVTVLETTSTERGSCVHAHAVNARSAKYTV